MDANQRILKVVEFVQQKQAEAVNAKPELAAALDYRWKHTLRVVQYGIQMAKAEGANVELVTVGCLLHDIAKLSDVEHNVDHGRVGARMARPLLLELGYAPAEVENVCYGIAIHVDDKSDFEHPLTIEALAISDADNIDRFGAYRILTHYHGDIDNYEGLIERAKKRLERCYEWKKNNPMTTISGKKLFERQIDLQITYAEQLIEDSQITILPEL